MEKNGKNVIDMISTVKVNFDVEQEVTSPTKKTKKLWSVKLYNIQLYKVWKQQTCTALKIKNQPYEHFVFNRWTRLCLKVVFFCIKNMKNMVDNQSIFLNIFFLMKPSI